MMRPDRRPDRAPLRRSGQPGGGARRPATAGCRHRAAAAASRRPGRAARSRRPRSSGSPGRAGRRRSPVGPCDAPVRCGQIGDCVAPILGPAAVIGWSRCADDRNAGGTNRAAARLALGSVHPCLSIASRDLNCARRWRQLSKRPSLRPRTPSPWKREDLGCPASPNQGHPGAATRMRRSGREDRRRRPAAALGALRWAPQRRERAR